VKGGVRPPDFPEELVRFIRRTLPTYRAAEVLVSVARDPARAWSTDEIVAVFPGLTAEAVHEYLAHFAQEGLVVADEAGRHRYAPRSEDLRAAVVLLTEAYDRRPVTLVRVMDSLGTERIRSFADSFRLKKRDR